MTITTEEAEAHATALERGSILYRAHAAAALRALAAERDIANEQIYGLAEEREKWKERAERAERRLGDLLAVIHRDGGQFWAVHGDEAAVNKAHHAWAALIARAERAEAKTERLRNAFRVNALRWNPEMSHAEIDAEIDRAALDGGEAKPDKLRDSVTAVIIAYEHDIAQGVEPSEDRRRVIAVLRAALEGGDNADQQDRDREGED